MWTEWTKSAVTFARAYQRYADCLDPEIEPPATDEELAIWLYANPTGSFEDWHKEKNAHLYR